jgi:hypothetical protein
MANELDLLAQLEILKSENEKLKSQQQKATGITIKLGEKKNICIYGLGRWPVSLYKSQADKLFSEETVAQVRRFIKDNEGKLAVKE